MNLALLDPFRRQIPDRIDSTLSLPPNFHPRRPRGGRTTNANSEAPSNKKKDKKRKSDESNSKSRNSSPTNRNEKNATELPDDDSAGEEDIATLKTSNGGSGGGCPVVKFNRRGTFLVVGHGSGAASVHDFASRTLSSLIHPPYGYKYQHASPSFIRHVNASSLSAANRPNKLGIWNAALPIPFGQDPKTAVTYATWSRKSRRLLLASAGDVHIRLLDNTHPFGTLDISNSLFHHSSSSGNPNNDPNTTNSNTKSTKKKNNIEGDSDTLSIGTNNNNNSTPKKKSRTNPSNNSNNTTNNSSSRSNASNVYLHTSTNYGTVCPLLRNTQLTTTTIPEDDDDTYDSDKEQSLNHSNFTFMRARLIPDLIVLEPTNNNSNNEMIKITSENDNKPTKIVKDESTTAKSAKNANEYNTNKKNANSSTDYSMNTALPNSKPELHELLNKLNNDNKSEKPPQEECTPDSMVISSSSPAQKNKISSTRSNSPTNKIKSAKKKKKNKRGTDTYNSNVASTNSTVSDGTSGSGWMSWVPPSPRRYQTIVLTLPSPVGHTAQIHPVDANAALISCMDGSLLMVRFPHKGFLEQVTGSVKQLSTEANLPGSLDPTRWSESVRRTEREKVGKLFYLNLPPPPNNEAHKQKYFVTTAALGKQGEMVFGATQCGKLLGWKIPTNWMEELQNTAHPPLQQPMAPDDSTSLNSPIMTSAQVNLPNLQTPTFCVDIPGGSSIQQMVISRNGRLLLLNSSDGALRLYDTHELQMELTNLTKAKSTINVEVKPRFVFQDMVNNSTTWACCDFSGDGEYVVAGCNGQPPGDHYELHLWNTSTGALLDQLEGPSGISVQSTSWHPTRSFIAVSTSDGLVDLWGPRMDWTAFAPDFQALPRNMEYIEKEDEFDCVVSHDDKDDKDNPGRRQTPISSEEDEIVDVITVDKIPVFDSDSEEETEVFSFETKVIGLLHSGRRGKTIGNGNEKET